MARPEKQALVPCGELDSARIRRARYSFSYVNGAKNAKTLANFVPLLIPEFDEIYHSEHLFPVFRNADESTPTRQGENLHHWG